MSSPNEIFSINKLVSTAVILAGGFGTRLQQVVSDLPKPMAPVNDFPFLHYIIKDLRDKKFTRIILAVGYKYESIMHYFGNSYLGIDIDYSVEAEPLGTGGAILQGVTFTVGPIAIINGDTFFDVDFNKMFSAFKNKKADIAIALNPMKNFDRYGAVIINSENRITSFEEKKHVDVGYINGGVYVMDASFFESHNFDKKFSFEKEVLEKLVATKHFEGVIFDNYFIDIGIPEDYYKAQSDFR